MKDQYADLARDYDWLYSDRRQVGERQVRSAAGWLDTVEGARILDCACGTGMFALALARHGYDVVGTDASAEMIAQRRGLPAEAALGLAREQDQVCGALARRGLARRALRRSPGFAAVAGADRSAVAMVSGHTSSSFEPTTCKTTVGVVF